MKGMTSAKEKILQLKIQDLELELRKKSSELLLYKNELKKLSLQIEGMTLRMGAELNAAQRLQKMLSPTDLPRIGGVNVSSKFIPGSQYGGDYLDLFEYEDRLKFGVLVSSASGYAMSSLLLTVIFSLTSKIQAKKPLEPALFMTELISKCQEQMGAQDAFSLFFGVMERRSFEMSYCLLGSIDAFHQSSKSVAIERLEPCADRILKETIFKPKPKVLQFESMDRLILMSEGLRNSKNPEGQFWGGDNVLEAIYNAPRSGVHELRNEILFKNEQFTKTETPEKDQTVLVMEVKDRLIKLASQ